MVTAISTAFRKKMMVQPVPYKPEDVMQAWAKIDRIVDEAYMDTHINTAQRMFERMLNRFGFTPEQCRSPLIDGMQAKINTARCNVIAVRK